MNDSRIRECMRKALRGEELTIGFLGGSITQGSLASKEEYTYACRVFRWWQDSFPNAVFHYVNGGIGGTNSHYGAARAVADLLMYQPDFAVVDFSVNDEPNAFYQETYEGMIRKILSWPSGPAVMLLGNVYYDTGRTAQEWHLPVAERYQLPYISIHDTIYQRMKEGAYAMPELTADGLHPNDRGHGLVADEIIRYLESVKMSVPKNRAAGEDVCLPRPLTENAYETARKLTIRESIPLLMGFRADPEEKTGRLDAFKNGWIGKRTGDRIIFRVKASCIAVQYRKSVSHPALSAKVILDGDEEHSFLLDGEFEEDWGDCQYLQPILHHGVYGEHTIECEVLPGKEHAIPFYLMSVIVA